MWQLNANMLSWERGAISWWLNRRNKASEQKTLIFLIILERRGLPVSGYLIPIGKRYNIFFCRFSSGETGANLIYTFLTSSKKFALIQKVSPSQSCSHRNSVQNGPVDKFTALMATLFVNISVFYAGMRYPIHTCSFVPSKALRFNNPTRRYAGILIPSTAVCGYGPVC